MNHNKIYQGYVLNNLTSQKYFLLAIASSEADHKWEALMYVYGVVDEKGNNEQVTSTWSLDKRAIAKCKNLDKI